MRRIINIFVFIPILIIGCNKSNKIQTINEDIEDVSVHISIELQEQESLNKKMYVNSPEGLRVRNLPSINGDRIGLLDHLTEIRITKENNEIVTIEGIDGKWVYIITPIEGWVFNGFLENEEQYKNRLNVPINRINLLTDGWVTPEIDVTGVILNDFLDIFRFNKNKRKSNIEFLDWVRYFETVLLGDTILYETNNAENSDGDAIAVIPSGTEIIILATISYYEDNYLIKLKNDTNLWTGWIRKSAVSENTISQIDNERKYLMPISSVSTRGDIFASDMFQTDEFIAVRKNGEVIYRIQDTEIKNLFPSAINNGELIGWTSDQRKIWFRYINPIYVECFGIIDIDTGRYIVFESPHSHVMFPYEINYDTGEIYYADLPYLFDDESARATKESGEIFHLYSYNFITKEKRVIDTNIGEGFDISFDRKYGFRYQKKNNY
jgi:hypothetical protein